MPIIELRVPLSGPGLGGECMIAVWLQGTTSGCSCLCDVMVRCCQAPIDTETAKDQKGFFLTMISIDRGGWEYGTGSHVQQAGLDIAT